MEPRDWPLNRDVRRHGQPVDGPCPAGERLECGDQPQVVQGRWSEFSYEMAEGLDLSVHIAQGLLERLFSLHRVAETVCVLESQPQRSQSLNRFVVQLSRPARPLALAREHAVAQPLALDRALRLQPLDDAASEIRRNRDLVTTECGFTAAQRDKYARLPLHRQG